MRNKDDDFLKRVNEFAFFEDTHDAKGNYIGKDAPAKQFTTPKPAQKPPKTLLSKNFNNMVVYEPRTPEDVEMLIDYLKRKEAAIVKLDCVSEHDAQRILDFFSGAVYALGGSVHRIEGNIFLLTPEGVTITAPLS